jgi:hypothetical protein
VNKAVAENLSYLIEKKYGGLEAYLLIFFTQYYFSMHFKSAMYVM